MDRELIEEKLESLRRCVQRVHEKTPATAERLMQDPDLQDIISINLARAVQLSVDIAMHILADAREAAPHTMAGAFDGLNAAGLLDEETAIRMKKAVGFRNIAVHAYEKIDWAIVHSICSERLGDFEHFVAAVVQVINRE